MQIGKHRTSNIEHSTSICEKSAARFSLIVRCWILVVGCFFSSLCRAEDFGDVSVTTDSIYTGNTFHGYAETRVYLRNRSLTKSHSVALIYPNNSWSSGNSINRISRTVLLAPGVTQTVPLFQPPLPLSGDNQIRVEVDGRYEGVAGAPNGNKHLSGYNRNGAGVLFISRSLDSEAAEKIFSGNHTGFTAEMATGTPNSRGRYNSPQTTWMPDTRHAGATNWLELEYAIPRVAERLNVHNLFPLPPAGEIILIGSSGTNLATIPMSSGSTSYPRATSTDFTFPKTSEPVKTVRLNFGTASPSGIAIDAVEISGPLGRAWASDARASSDNSAAAPSTPPAYYGASADTIESLRAESTVSAWSEDWLAYTPFDAIALDTSDFNSMSPAVLTALGNYLQAGGIIFVFGGGALPPSWHAFQKNGFAGGEEFHVGFGDCIIFPDENFSRFDSKNFAPLRNKISAAARYWLALPSDTSAANNVLPIVKNLKIPVRGIVLIMLAFIIIIGPVNIIYLNRRKRRTWMLWTIPAISFATTLLVFAYSLLREGITPDTLITGITVLDQQTHHASTLGGTAFYSPLTPGGGLHFDFETEVTPLVNLGYDRSGGSREMDWTQSQHLAHGWISARVPVYFHLRKSETRRERLQLENENGKLQIVNGLGAPIKSLWLADQNGKIFLAQNVSAGEKINLRASPDSDVSEKSGVDGLNHDFGFAVNHLEDLDANAEKYLLPGTYVAVLDGNPFIENALASSVPKRTKTSSIVFGILDSTETQ